MPTNNHAFSFVLNSDASEVVLVKQVGFWIEVVSASLQTQIPLQNVEKLDHGISMYLWQESSTGVWIRLVLDTQMPVRCLSIEDGPEERRRRIGELLCEDLPIVPLNELKNTAQQALADGKTPSAMTRLALGVNEPYDADIANLLINGLKSKNLEYRVAAATGINVLKWKYFLGDLRATAAIETDDAAQKIMNIVAEKIMNQNSEQD